MVSVLLCSASADWGNVVHVCAKRGCVSGIYAVGALVVCRVFGHCVSECASILRSPAHGACIFFGAMEQERSVERLKEFLRIRTVHPTPAYRQAITWLQDTYATPLAAAYDHVSFKVHEFVEGKVRTSVNSLYYFCRPLSFFAFIVQLSL